MAGFLDNYEDVAARIKRFWETHPSGRIENNIIEFNAEKGFILVQTLIFKEYEDEKPSAIDYAFGNVATYNVQMKKFFCEDTVTSSIGRCIGLLLGTDKRPTRQDMEKVERLQAVPTTEVDLWATNPEVKVEGVGSVRPAAESIDAIRSQLGGEIVESTPHCSHGRMVYKEGVSPKTGNKYQGYTCSSKSRSDQCKPIWL